MPNIHFSIKDLEFEVEYREFHVTLLCVFKKNSTNSLVVTLNNCDE